MRPPLTTRLSTFISKKNCLCSASILFTFSTIVGQDSTTTNSFIVESQVYPNWNTDSYKPALKLRLVLNENHVLRSNLLIDNSKKYREVFSTTGPNGGVGSIENINQFFGHGVLFESMYHDASLIS